MFKCGLLNFVYTCTHAYTFPNYTHHMFLAVQHTQVRYVANSYIAQVFHGIWNSEGHAQN